MAKDDAMRERLQSLETRFDRLEQKVDLLPTKADWGGLASKTDLAGFATKADLAAIRADLAGFATKADLEAFANSIADRMGIMLDDVKDSVTKAAEGYGATLERIERDLSDFRSEFRNKSDDTDRVLTDHVNRIVALERITGVARD